MDGRKDGQTAWQAAEKAKRQAERWTDGGVDGLRAYRHTDKRTDGLTDGQTILNRTVQTDSQTGNWLIDRGTYIEMDGLIDRNADKRAGGQAS
jgi:hypothetical protein